MVEECVTSLRTGLASLRMPIPRQTIGHHSALIASVLHRARTIPSVFSFISLANHWLLKCRDCVTLLPAPGSELIMVLSCQVIDGFISCGLNSYHMTLPGLQSLTQIDHLFMVLRKGRQGSGFSLPRLSRAHSLLGLWWPQQGRDSWSASGNEPLRLGLHGGKQPSRKPDV